ncbi:hypothetical protein LTR08_007113 [Meristemomyces frigidus]|nr:hypothetical protein LTR08_007113 [Meristemomyces frigidus]
MSSSPTAQPLQGSISAEAISSSKAHHQRTHILLKTLGAGDNGDIHASILRSDVDQTTAKHDRRTAAFYKELRAKVVAVKFVKPSTAEGDLENEITFLTQCLTTRSVRVVHCINSVLNDNVQWLTTPYCSGGDLQSFINDHGASLNTSFIWHAGLELCEALSFLLYGVTKETQTHKSNRPKIFHGDIFTGNILLRPSTNGFKTFPDLVVADFGRATQLVIRDAISLTAKTHHRLYHALEQVQDLATVGQILTGMQNMMLAAPDALPPDEFLKEWIAELQDFEGDEAGLRSVVAQVARGLPFIRKFMLAARREREATYQPLGLAGMTAVNAVNITDADLALALT